MLAMQLLVSKNRRRWNDSAKTWDNNCYSPGVHSKGRIRSPVYLSSWQVEDDNIIMTIRVGSFIRGGHYSGWTRLEWKTPVVILYAIISIMALVLN